MFNKLFESLDGKKKLNEIEDFGIEEENSDLDDSGKEIENEKDVKKEKFLYMSRKKSGEIIVRKVIVTRQTGAAANLGHYNLRFEDEPNREIAMDKRHYPVLEFEDHLIKQGKISVEDLWKYKTLVLGMTKRLKK